MGGRAPGLSPCQLTLRTVLRSAALRAYPTHLLPTLCPEIVGRLSGVKGSLVSKGLFGPPASDSSQGFGCSSSTAETLGADGPVLEVSLVPSPEVTTPAERSPPWGWLECGTPTPFPTWRREGWGPPNLHLLRGGSGTLRRRQDTHDHLVLRHTHSGSHPPLLPTCFPGPYDPQRPERQRESPFQSRQIQGEACGSFCRCGHESRRSPGACAWGDAGSALPGASLQAGGCKANPRLSASAASAFCLPGRWSWGLPMVISTHAPAAFRKFCHMWQLLSINSPAGRRLGVTDTLGRGPALRVPVSCLRGQNPRQIQMPETYREPGG